MNKSIKYIPLWILMATAVFAVEVETKAYVLEDICQFKPIKVADNLSENVNVEVFENEVKKVLSSYEIEDLRVLVDLTNKLCSGNIWKFNSIYVDELDESALAECKNRELILEIASNVLKSLFENPAISGYLGRENYEVDTKGDVIFSKMEEDFYFTLANIGFKDNSFYINYRCAIKEDGQNDRDFKIYNQSKLFYESGSSPLIGKRLVANTVRIKNEKLQNESNMFYEFVGDIYEVAAKLKEIENENSVYVFSDKTDYAYFIMPGAKDNHAYFTMAIVNAKTKKT